MFLLPARDLREHSNTPTHRGPVHNRGIRYSGWVTGSAVTGSPSSGWVGDWVRELVLGDAAGGLDGKCVGWVLHH